MEELIDCIYGVSECGLLEGFGIMEELKDCVHGLSECGLLEGWYHGRVDRLYIWCV